MEVRPGYSKYVVDIRRGYYLVCRRHTSWVLVSMSWVQVRYVLELRRGSVCTCVGASTSCFSLVYLGSPFAYWLSLKIFPTVEQFDS